MNKPKVLGIKAAGRSDSNTDIILKELLRPSREKGFDVEVISLPKFNLRHCSGCFGCNNGELRCILQDDLETIKQKIAVADALALAAPCFAIGAPSVLKTVMDRSAVWALDQIARGCTPKFGAAVMVGGADGGWLSLQRTLPAEFLKLYNCRTIGMFTIEGVGLKAELLLSPSKLEKVRALGLGLAESLADGEVRRFDYSERKERLVCPICYCDTFHVDRRGRYVCAVCDVELRRHARFASFSSRTRVREEGGTFSRDSAKSHNDFIGAKISRLFGASDEVRARSQAYFERDSLPSVDFSTERVGGADLGTPTAWEEGARTEFERVVPAAFRRFVLEAVERRARAMGVGTIDKETFLRIKRESGN